MIQQEEILKGYDPALMKRLLAYVKPYLFSAILALTALLLATTGEMSLPILIQKAVDEHILPFFRKIDPAGAGTEILTRIGAEDRSKAQSDDHWIGSLLFVPASRLIDLSTSEKAELISRGALSEEDYLVIEIDSSSSSIIDRYPDLFTVGESGDSGGRPSPVHAVPVHAAMRAGDLQQLSRDEIVVLRQRHYRGLTILALQFLGILACILIASFGQIYLLTYIAQMVMRDIRTELFGHTIRLSLKYLEANPVGRLVTRITNDVETINELFSTVITSFLKDISLMVGVFVILFILNTRLALLTLLCFPPVVAATYIYRSKARDAFRWVRSAVSKVNGFLSEHLSGMGIIQLFAREQLTGEEFAERNEELKRANLREMHVFSTFRPLIDLLAMTTLAVILYLGAGAYLRNILSLGVLIAFLNLIRRFFEPVGDMAEKYNILQSAMAGSERVFDLMDKQEFILPPEAGSPDSYKSATQSGQRHGSIAFDRVRFAYKKDEWVLNDLSFEVQSGETVAIVGYTGAGKTTIASLLARLWDIQGGRILLDGVNIRNLPTDVLRRQVQSVLQEVFIFSGTVEENIRLGSDISFEQIQRASRLVRADVFVDSLPDGYATVLSERGSNLSTGQRQLLSFARVVAHDPELLVMDEATANIDSETETLIQEALGNLLEGRTSIVIAHRLSTIKRADRILVIHGGKLVEEGDHATLLRDRGIYYNLYQMQFLAEEKR